jgi:NAD(P)-dependent dehydrogenase (short-subunit alcohol dehydrogenase family)
LIQGLVRTLARAGWRVAGTCRDDDRRASLAASGVEAHVWRPDDGRDLLVQNVYTLNPETYILSPGP